MILLFFNDFQGEKMVKYLNEVLFLIYVDIFTSLATEINWWYIFSVLFWLVPGFIKWIVLLFQEGKTLVGTEDAGRPQDIGM